MPPLQAVASSRSVELTRVLQRTFDASSQSRSSRRFKMSNRITYVKQATTLVIALSCIALSSIGGADNVNEKRKSPIADEELFFAPVPKAVCGPGDKPETALQGQVTAQMRATGFQGFSCNL